MRRLSSALLLTLAASLLAPAAVLAQGTPTANPFAPGIPQATPTVPPTAPAPLPVAPNTNAGSSGGGLSGGAAVAIAIGAVIVLGGISFFIWRDARKRAPVRERPVRGQGELGSRPGSKSRRGSRKLSQAEKRRRKRGRAR